MSMICVMCQQGLLGSTECPSPSNGQSINIMSAICGHMIHELCLLDWFRAEDTRSSVSGQKARKSCPHCQKMVDPVGFFRIYPTFDEGSGSGSGGQGSAQGSSSSTSTAAALKEKCEDLGKLVCFLENENEMLKLKLQQEQIMGSYSHKSVAAVPVPVPAPGPVSHSPAAAANSQSQSQKLITTPDSSGSQMDYQMFCNRIAAQISKSQSLALNPTAIATTCTTTSSPSYISSLNSTPYRAYYQPVLGQCGSAIQTQVTPRQSPPFHQQPGMSIRTPCTNHYPQVSSAPPQLSPNQQRKNNGVQLLSAFYYGNHRMTPPSVDTTNYYYRTIHSMPANGPTGTLEEQQRPFGSNTRNPYPCNPYNRVGQMYPGPRGYFPPLTDSASVADPSITLGVNPPPQQYAIQQPSTIENDPGRFGATSLGDNPQSSASERFPLKPWREFAPF